MSKVVTEPRVEQTQLGITHPYVTSPGAVTELTTSHVWEQFIRWVVPAGLKSLMIKEGDKFLTIIRDNATTPVQDVSGEGRFIVLDFKQGNKRILFEFDMVEHPTLTNAQDKRQWPPIERGARVPPSWFLGIEFHTATASDSTVCKIIVPAYEEYPFG